MLRISRLLVAAIAAAPVVAAPLDAQRRFPPDSLVNVSVIPRNTPVPEVIATMRAFSQALGVRCTYCHVGADSLPLTAYDFTSDEKRAKQVARLMMEMVVTLNTVHLAAIPDRPAPPVRATCETCHRGVSRPMPIEQLVEAALGSAGVDSAGRAYRNLYEALRFRGAYDFTDAPLSALALRLARQRRFDEAIALLAVNDETHPGSANVPFARGEVLLARGDTAGAVAAYQQSAQRSPTGPGAQRLRQLRPPPAPAR
jgi:hypothetical protein